MVRIEKRGLALLALLGGLALSVSACKKNPATGNVSSSALAGLKAPAGFIALGGIDNAKAAIASVQKASGGMLPVSEPMIVAGLTQGFGMTDATVLNLAGPIRFAVANPKELKDRSAAFIFSITNRKAFAAAVPQATQNAEGNELKLVLRRGPPVFLNFIGDKAVVATFAPKLYAEHKAFWPQLLAAKLAHTISAELKIARIQAIFGDRFDRKLGRLKKDLSSAAVDREAFVGFVDGIATALRETEAIRFHVSFPQDGVRTIFELAPTASSKLSATLNKIKGHKNKLYDRLPAGSAAVAGFYAGKEVQKLLEDALGAMMQIIPKTLPGAAAGLDLKRYFVYAKDFWAATNGEMVSAWYSGADGKPARGGIFGLSDSAKAEAAMNKLVGIYADPSLKEIFEKQGIRASIKKEAYQLRDMQVTTIEVTRPAVAMLKGGPESTHTAFGKSFGFMAQGGNAKATLEQLIDGKPAKPLTKSPGFKRALEAVGAKHLALVYVSPTDLMPHLMGAMGGMMGGPATGAKAGPDGGVALGITARGGDISLIIDAPQAQIQSIAQTVTRVMSMFMGMRRR